MLNYAVGITDDVWLTLCNGQAEGKIITATVGCKQTLTDPSVPT